MTCRRAPYGRRRFDTDHDEAHLKETALCPLNPGGTGRLGASRIAQNSGSVPRSRAAERLPHSSSRCGHRRTISPCVAASPEWRSAHPAHGRARPGSQVPNIRWIFQHVSTTSALAATPSSISWVRTSSAVDKRPNPWRATAPELPGSLVMSQQRGHHKPESFGCDRLARSSLWRRFSYRKRVWDVSGSGQPQQWARAGGAPGLAAMALPAAWPRRARVRSPICAHVGRGRLLRFPEPLARCSSLSRERAC
jgi:hypothetical protein